MKYLLLALSLFFICTVSHAQQHPLIRTFAAPQQPYCADSLVALYGHNKVLPERIKLPALLALAYYPELRNTKIIFKEANINTTLNARPTLGSLLFRKKENRTYVIRINNNAKREQNLLDQVPLNAKIGLLSHEFAHIADYVEKNILGVCTRGFSYFTKASKAQFEREIDHRTINQGLGWQLHDWANYILNESDASEAYKIFKRYTYLTPEEILYFISDDLGQFAELELELPGVEIL